MKNLLGGLLATVLGGWILIATPKGPVAAWSDASAWFQANVTLVHMVLFTVVVALLGVIFRNRLPLLGVKEDIQPEVPKRQGFFDIDVTPVAEPTEHDRITKNGRKVLGLFVKHSSMPFTIASAGRLLGWTEQQTKPVVGFLRQNGYVRYIDGFNRDRFELTLKGQMYVQEVKTTTLR
jgi:hypothetical protein